MKKLLALLLVLALCAALPLAASADMTAQPVATLTRSPYLCTATNCYYTRTDEGYQLFDAAGNVLSAAYGNMTPRQNGLYIEVRNESGMNTYGLLDASGKELLPMAYGDFEFISDDWMLAYVLEPTDADTGEYKDSDGNRYNVGRADVLYKGAVIGSLTREDYVKSYNVGARGAWLYVKTSSTHAYWLDSSFNRVDVTDDSYVSTNEFYDIYKKGVFHNPTQQYAFTAGCTLTADQVEQSVWYDDSKSQLIDLQGNVIADQLYYDYAYFRKDHFVVKRDGLCGIIDLNGKEIVPPTYEDIAYSNDELFTSGYNMVLDEKGCLSFIDETGAVTASVSYQLSSSDYKGYIYNAPFAVVNNMGRYMVITATNGELAETYDDFTTARGGQRILCVKKGDVWGCIDLEGNTVIPFEHRSSLSISADGTLVCGQNTDRQYVIYTVSYGDAADKNWTVAMQSGEDMDTTPVLNEGAWACSCGTITNGKFCPECGTPMPTPEPTATPAPVADGSWVCANCNISNTSKFCPECGSAKPVEPVVCSGCGYDPGETAPKFCPECGTKF